MPAYYKLSDFIVLTSIGPEGLPKVVTEALAMGIPVIASDRGGTWELLREGKNGWKISDPVTPDTILTAFYKALSIGSEDLAGMKQYIYDVDRPKMDHIRMITAFQEELRETMERKGR